MAFLPAYNSAEEMLNDSAELIVLKVDDSEGEEMLVTVDDEDILQKVFDMFVERLEVEEEEEEEEEASIFEDDEENI
jgi:hypothetical protein